MTERGAGWAKLVTGATRANGRSFTINRQREYFLGHMRVLAQVIDRAQRLMPSGSLLALVQPDRLVSVIPGEEASQTMRERMETAVKESYLVDGVPIHVAAGIGVAHFPAHAATAEELLQKASIAMHWANSSKSAISLYDTANDRTSRENLILLGGLSDAIVRGELQVWHQAKIALATGEVTGTEALLRWKHPQRGIVPPGNFLPQVEETTLINSVTQVMNLNRRELLNRPEKLPCLSSSPAWPWLRWSGNRPARLRVG